MKPAPISDIAKSIIEMKVLAGVDLSVVKLSNATLNQVFESKQGREIADKGFVTDANALQNILSTMMKRHISVVVDDEMPPDKVWIKAAD